MAVVEGTPNFESGQSRSLTKVGWVLAQRSPPTPININGPIISTDDVIIAVDRHPEDGNVSGLRIFDIDTGNWRVSACSPVSFNHRKPVSHDYRSKAGYGDSCAGTGTWPYGTGHTVNTSQPIVVIVDR